MLLPGRDSWRTCQEPREGTSMRHVVVALLALAQLGPISPSWADSTSGSSTPAQVGYGAGSFLGTLLYTPAKASFCLLGVIGSAPTATVSTRTAGKIVGASCRGTLVITPEVLQGREKLKFIGYTPDQAAAPR